MATKTPLLAEECFARESRLFEKTKRTDLVTVILFCAVLFGVLFTAILLPDRDRSEDENRMLQTFPKISKSGAPLANLWNGNFTKEFADYCADQFPGRDFFVGVESTAEIALGKGGNNGVLYGRDGYLIAEPAVPDEVYENNLRAIASYSDGLPLTLAVPGRTVDVMKCAYPALYDGTAADQPWEALGGIGGGVSLCDVLTPLRKAALRGESVAYRTDHHWTTHGAYLAYREIVSGFGLVPFEESAFRIETVTENFRGTTWSTAGFKFVPGEPIEYYRWDGDEDVTVTVAFSDGGPRGLYDRSLLEEKDKYGSFLGGNFSILTVESDKDLPWLLLYKDSYANALVPLLARHYNVVAVDPRYYRVGFEDVTEGIPFERILVLYNMDTLLTDRTVAAAPVLE